MSQELIAVAHSCASGADPLGVVIRFSKKTVATRLSDFRFHLAELLVRTAPSTDTYQISAPSNVLPINAAAHHVTRVGNRIRAKSVGRKRGDLHHVLVHRV